MGTEIMKVVTSVLSVFFLLFLAASGQSQSKPAADLIVNNAKVWTVDKLHPTAQAVAVLGERIVAVGSIAEVNAWRGPNTRVIDAAGKLLLPGFNDSHVHFVSGGAQLDNVQLNDATSPEEFARRIGARTKNTAKGEWILGGDWDETKWNPTQLPTKELIDPVTPDTPVFVNRYDGHMALANSLALRMAGVSAKTPDPPGGTIVRDAQGNPTGALKDAAMEYVNKVIPPLTHEQRLLAVKRALAHAASFGVTSVQDMNPEYADIAVFSELLQRGELTARIYAAPFIMRVDDQAKIGIRHAFGGPYLRIGALKGYADGSLGSATAYFFDPFTDQPSNHGLLSDEMQPVSVMRDRMMTVYAAATRASLDGKNPNGWFPEQKLTVEETVEAYTMGSAYAEFQEKEKGSISPGKLADMVLLSDNIFSTDPTKIRDVKALVTIVGGRIVWDRIETK